MVFSSIIFLLLFFPVVLLVYHLFFLPVTLDRGAAFWRGASNLFLFMASLLFYFWGEQFLVWIIIASTSIDYICGLVISGGWRRGRPDALVPGGPRSRTQKGALAFSICSNLAFLGFFKYFNFGVDNYNNIMAGFGLTSMQWKDALQVTLPLGISFYTFQSMSYTIDVFRGHVRATRNLVDFAAFVTMFPQLVAGPIVRYRDVAEQLISRRVDLETFSSGVSRFIVGLAKKVLVANTVAAAADGIFALDAADLTPGLAWLGILAYTLQIYFDFSGYSDMAIGLGRMLGFSFPENFRYPYIASSVQDFWRRWHISLSSWFRDYLYIPLGGSRVPPLRVFFNLITVFFLCGLWHGAKWTMVVWGLFHGFFLGLERTGFKRLLQRWPAFGHLFTLLVVVVGWVLFRAETFTQAMHFLGAMVGISQGGGVYPGVDQFLTYDVMLMSAVGVVLSAPLIPALGQWLRKREDSAGGFSWWVAAPLESLSLVVLAGLLLLSLVFLAPGTYNPFLYFRF